MEIDLRLRLSRLAWPVVAGSGRSFAGSRDRQPEGGAGDGRHSAARCRPDFNDGTCDAAGLSVCSSPLATARTPSIREVYCGGLARALSWMPKQSIRFLTLVRREFGHAVGGVDETTECEPLRKAESLPGSEDILRQSGFGARRRLRLAGITVGADSRSNDLIAGGRLMPPLMAG
jgi:hypothetical protein